MINGTARLIYDPRRPEDFRKVNKTRTLVAQLRRDDLDLYYQWFLKRKYGEFLEIQRPMFGTHITVVRGDEFIQPKFLNYWKKYENQQVSFEYDPTSIERHWRFWAIKVQSKDLQQIREELGLKHQIDFHITIGRQHDWQPLV